MYLQYLVQKETEYGFYQHFQGKKKKVVLFFFSRLETK